MDEIELRLGALELLFIELSAWLDAAALEDAARSIAAGLDQGDSDERAVRAQALELLKDARGRFGGYSG